MWNVVLLIVGVVALSFSLFRWDAVLDNIGAGLRAVWLGVWALVTTKDRGVAYWLRVFGLALALTSFVLALTVGPRVDSGNPRDALDRAIRDFQAYAGLVVDGIFGPATVEAYYGHR